jgi:hypothetical protein
VIAEASAFVIYLWHYVVARLLYDDLLRPLTHGHVPATLLLALAAGAGFGLGRKTRRRA